MEQETTLAKFRISSPPSHIFLLITLQFEEVSSLPFISAPLFKKIVLSALKSFHGQSGEGIAVDILKVIPNPVLLSHQAILRVPENHSTAVWSALTFLCEYDSKTCRIVVNKAVGNLLSLAVDSRSFNPF